MSNTASESPPTLEPEMTRDEVAAVFLPAYKEACERLKARHGDNYSRYLKDEVPGLTGVHQERALKWLHVEAKQLAHSERIRAVLEAGWIEAEQLVGPTERDKRHPLVVLAGRGKDCTDPSRKWGVGIDPATEWIEIPDARILFDAKGTPKTVVPKGYRTTGTTVCPLRVLVKRNEGPETAALFTAAE